MLKTVMSFKIELIKEISENRELSLHEVYLVSPDWLNFNDKWGMHLLSKIQRGSITSDNDNLTVEKYITADGQELISDISGVLESNEDRIVFSDMLVF